MTSPTEKAFEAVSEPYRRHVSAALAALDVRNLVLSLHASSFPSLPEEDAGRGSPYTQGGLRFLEFAHALGFNGIQLGPPGQVSEDNAPPYDGTLSSRNTLDNDMVPLASEAWGHLVRQETVASLVTGRPVASEPRVRHRSVF